MSAEQVRVASAPPALTNVAELLDDPSSAPLALVEVGRTPEAAGQASSLPVLRLTLDEVSGKEGPRTGRRPLPERSALTARLRAAGITGATHVVVYAETPRDLSAAARVWLVLRWAGVARVSLLNGAHASEVAELTDELARRAPRPDAGDDGFAVDRDLVIDAAQLEARDAGVLLIDARGTEAFGDDSQHLPGAINLPSAELTHEGALVSDDALVAAYRRHGVDPLAQPIVLYCGSGVAASVQALALAQLGVRAPVYVGSWSEWEKIHPPA